MSKKVSVIGAAIMDIIAGPVSEEVFRKGSVPAERMGISFGGDALNEAVVLSLLGVDTELISVLGDDETGKSVLDYLKERGVLSDKITVSKDMTTGMNIVLTDREGERYFVTNPESSLRKLSKEHILPGIETAGEVISFASMFVSHKLEICDMREIFEEIKKKPGRILVSDMTTAKKGEKVKDIAPLLKLVDYIIPNDKEAALITGEADPLKSAEILSEYGARCVIIKCGKDGCIFKQGDSTGAVPAFPTKALDSTGAGDSFAAGFIYGLINGMNLEDCCRFGNAAASFVVEGPGSLGNLKTKQQVIDRLTV